MKKLSEGEKFSILYHNIFNYPLTDQDLKIWSVNPKTQSRNTKQAINIKKFSTYYFLEGREEIVQQRIQNEKASKKKLNIAQKAAAIISKIPAIKLVAVSGALAMNNASEDSDVDLLVITSRQTLWITRPFVYAVLKLHSFQIRSPKDANEKDRLCLNLWMDESDLDIREKNIYTAHELAQLVPLVNKNKTYEKLMAQNKWVKDYWPNAIKARSINIEKRNNLVSFKIKYLNIVLSFVLRVSNLFMYTLQKLYMNSKMTRETVTLTRAFFHPRDWGKEIEQKLKV